MTHRILILGGTTEARRFAGAIARRPDLDVTLSLAGRTMHPLTQPVTTRTGGFGGMTGLERYLTHKKIDVLVDATHPFAAVISANANAAAARAGVEYFAIRRPAWQPVAGDLWHQAGTLEQAIVLAGRGARRIFVAAGRKELAPLLEAPDHHYLIRSIDPIEPPPDLPHVSYILARGPFNEDDEREVLRRHRIDLVIAKNSGGAASYAKLAAARALAIPVILIARPPAPEGPSVANVGAAEELLDHLLAPRKERGE